MTAPDNSFFDPDAQRGWEEFLLQFDTLVYPTFAKYGFSRNTALVAWMLNGIANEVADSHTT